MANKPTDEKDEPHSHVWIDPTDPPIEREPYAPWYGQKRHELKPDRTYRCRVCPATINPLDAAITKGEGERTASKKSPTGRAL